MISKRTFSGLLAVVAVLGMSMGHAWAQAVKAPETLIEEVSVDVLNAVKADKSIQAGDVAKVIVLVDAKVMPHVNFQKMTALAVGGRYWNQATPEQKKRLQEEFKTLLVRAYSGALAQVKDQTVRLKPSRPMAEGAKTTIVKTEVLGKGDPLQLDYQLEKTDAGWKIIDVYVAGVSLAQSNQNSFSQELGASGIDGLISKLGQLNKNAASGGSKS
ncbi:MAG: ABC transporter substrate-binding protein [Burkholderiaceae bacterium]